MSIAWHPRSRHRASYQSKLSPARRSAERLAAAVEQPEPAQAEAEVAEPPRPERE